MTDATPHSPQLRYLCDDPECCDNGCPDVRCRACRKEWPCPDWRSRHTPSQINAQIRYTTRKHFPGDEDMVEYVMRREGVPVTTPTDPTTLEEPQP